jgi:hypothetical protein
MMRSATILAVLAAAALWTGCGGNGANVTPEPIKANQPQANQPAPPQNAPPKNDPPSDPQPEPEPDPVPQVESEYIAFEGGLRVYPARRVIEMDAWLLGAQTRPLEYLLVAPSGNTHESLFATAASGVHLKRGLEIILLNEGEIKRSGRGYLEKPVGDRVKMSVRFAHDETGVETTVPVEDWLWDHQANSNPEKSGFIFTGSYEQFRPELNRSLFEADMKGNLIALWRDASCVLDNDREHAWRPDIYAPHPEADGIPKRGMGGSPQVVLIFEPWKD